MTPPLFGSGGQQAAPLPYDPQSPEGLAARWTRWVAGLGPMHNPVSDRTGADAAIDQPDDVAGARLNPVTRSHKPIQMTVWGLWATIDALPEGAHTLRITGGLGAEFALAVTYHLDIR